MQLPAQEGTPEGDLHESIVGIHYDHLWTPASVALAAPRGVGFCDGLTMCRWSGTYREFKDHLADLILEAVKEYVDGQQRGSSRTAEGSAES